MPDPSELWNYAKIGGFNDCWPWQKKLYKHGYGSFHCCGKDDRPSRVSYQLKRGPIPRGIIVCHSCDNPPCINPSHLFLGTHDDNMKDMVNKGRHWVPQGENHKHATLTDEQAIYAMARCLTDREPQKEIAAFFGVKNGVIAKIWLGINRKHLWERPEMLPEHALWIKKARPGIIKQKAELAYVAEQLSLLKTKLMGEPAVDHLAQVKHIDPSFL